ncbi:MAG: hypothetical protein ACTSYB_04970 [Candidatus Helarchaeota archaeon]
MTPFSSVGCPILFKVSPSSWYCGEGGVSSETQMFSLACPTFHRTLGLSS